jgi:hypothetical protein
VWPQSQVNVSTYCPKLSDSLTMVSGGRGGIMRRFCRRDSVSVHPVRQQLTTVYVMRSAATRANQPIGSSQLICWPSFQVLMFFVVHSTIACIDFVIEPVKTWKSWIAGTITATAQSSASKTTMSESP